MKFLSVNSKIVFLVSIQIALIAVSVLILTNYESQDTLLGNSINVASHNLQLVDKVILEMEKYRIGEPFVGTPTLALANLNENINVLMNGGSIRGLEVSPLPEQFDSKWDELHIEYLNFASTSKQISNIRDSGGVITELDILFLEDSMREIASKSTILANSLTKYTEERSQGIISLQIVLAAANIVAHIILIIIIVRTLRGELKQKLKIEKELIETRRKKTEEVLYEVIPNPVVTFDQNSKLVDCNQYFLDVMGFSKDEILGKYAPNFLTEEDKNAFDEILSTLKEGKEQMEVDLHIKKKDGSIFHSLWSHIPIYDNNNEYQGFSGIGLDLTEIDRLRDELVKKEKISTVGQLATNLAHDIKNPLASMKQSLEIIQRRAKEDEISKKESERANRVIKRIEHQVDQVLNYVKTTPLQATHTTILTILKQSLDLLTIPNNISIEIPEEDFGVIWDETQISVVFTNIILNAIQAIEKNTGKISIRAAQENDSIKIEIEDTGPNIPEKDLNKIFEPLFTTKMEGTGLGLAGCKNIIQSHKGTFTVTNNPVKFTIKIPKNLDDFN